MQVPTVPYERIPERPVPSFGWPRTWEGERLNTCSRWKDMHETGQLKGNTSSWIGFWTRKEGKKKDTASYTEEILMRSVSWKGRQPKLPFGEEKRTHSLTSWRPKYYSYMWERETHTQAEWNDGVPVTANNWGIRTKGMQESFRGSFQLFCRTQTRKLKNGANV